MQVQAILADNRSTATRNRAQRRASLQASSSTRRGTPHTDPRVKKGTRYRYYVSRSLITTTSDNANRPSAQRQTGRRIPAPALEGLVKGRLIGFLEAPTDVMDVLADKNTGCRDQPSGRAAAPFGSHRRSSPAPTCCAGSCWAIVTRIECPHQCESISPSIAMRRNTG